MNGLASSSVLDRRLERDRPAMITARMLLKSCAMPSVSCPIASSFCGKKVDPSVENAAVNDRILRKSSRKAIGTGDVFCKGRDFGAWLGLVPKQISTGDRTILGKISKRGNRYAQHAIRASRSHRPGQARKLGALRPQALDRGRCQTPSPQRPGDRARQQAGAHRLECAASRPQLRGQENVEKPTPNPREPGAGLGVIKAKPFGWPETGPAWTTPRHDAVERWRRSG